MEAIRLNYKIERKLGKITFQSFQKLIREKIIPYPQSHLFNKMVYREENHSMRTLLAALLLLPTIGYSANYSCNFTSEDGTGSLQISINKSNARVDLTNNGNATSYKFCKVEKDEIGLLVDCNSGNLDFMVLLNNEVRPASGGIMSSTHELFVDVDC